jgi:hypothetical protein
VETDEQVRIFKTTVRFVIAAIHARVGYPDVDFHELPLASNAVAKWLSEKGMVGGWVWESAGYSFGGLVAQNNYLTVTGLHAEYAEYEAWLASSEQNRHRAVANSILRNRGITPVDFDELFAELMHELK